MCCKNSNKAVAWSMSRSVSLVFPSLKPYRLCRWMEPICGGVYLAHWTRIAPFGQHCGSSRMYILVKVGGFHTIMNGLNATGYIMAGFGFQSASEGNLRDKHYSTHHVWPVTTVHSGPALSSLQPSITSLPQPPAPWFSQLRQRKEIVLICMKTRWLRNTKWLMNIWGC